MYNIISIGTEFPTIEYSALNEKKSLSDADIVLLDANINNVDYKANNRYAGLELFTDESSSEILDCFQYWNKEIINFLKTGKTIYILLSPKKDFYIYTGEKSFRGTGRSTTTINNVMSYNNYKFLPFSFNIINSKGENIIVTHSMVKNLFDHSKKFMKYEAYIEQDKSKIAWFTTKNKDKNLGAGYKVHNGYLIFIPTIELPENYSSKDGESWNKNAIVWGQEFVKCLVEINKSLNEKFDKTPTPGWVNAKDFELNIIEKIKNDINDINEEIKKKNELLENLKNNLEEKEMIKDLLFESGKSLENAVIKALEILGYKAENYNDGELEIDQVILSPEGDRFIGECEGKDNKDIDITKFRQLHDLISQDFEREEVEDKAYGLLLGNPQRFLSPIERNLDFTIKCKKAAERENIGLIRTTDLFYVVKYLIENEDENFKKDCRNNIKNQLGSIIQFPKLPDS
ncbi:MAG TPA: hypothetical protein VIL99_16150 [Ignavibacteria bacterium]